MEIAAADFNDIFWEPPESEFQPLLDFENEVLYQFPKVLLQIRHLK